MNSSAYVKSVCVCKVQQFCMDKMHHCQNRITNNPFQSVSFVLIAHTSDMLRFQLSFFENTIKFLSQHPKSLLLQIN